MITRSAFLIGIGMLLGMVIGARGQALILLTAVLAAATVVLAWATIQYMRAQEQPVVSAYFEVEREGWWIDIVLQNTGPGPAFGVVVTTDLGEDALADLADPSRKAERRVLFQDLSRLDSLSQLAPQQIVRHRWLYWPNALKTSSPADFTLTVTYSDRWNRRHEFKAPFRLRFFGDFETTYTPEPSPLEQIATTLKAIERRIERWQTPGS